MPSTDSPRAASARRASGARDSTAPVTGSCTPRSPFCAVWLWPEIVKRELPWFAAGIAVLLVPSAVGYFKFGRLTSYHTYMAKLTGVAMAAGAIALFAWNQAALFHVAIVLLVIEGLEELMITAELPAWHADVRSFRSAQRLRERAAC